MEANTKKLEELSARIALIEQVIMTPVVTRRDIKYFFIFGVCIIAIGALMLVGELYLMNRIDKVYILLLSV